MFLCSLTQQIPEEPVLTPRGILYDRSAIEKYLATSEVCPIDGQPLHIEDLIPIKSTSNYVTPGRIRSTSFNNTLQTLQNEWNSLEMELFETRKNLAQAKRELATALYENEAAKRVIAKLLEENKQLKTQI